MDPFFITPLRILEFVVGITIIIILHELGHFFVARKFGVVAEEMGLGLPPRARYIGQFLGVPLSINWLPLGAFVRLKGEETGPEGNAGSLYSVSPLKRSLIYFAGPAVNLLTAVLLLTVVAWGMGVPDNERLRIQAIAPGAPAADLLQVGDVVMAVDGQSFASQPDFSARVKAKAGEPVTLDLLREGKALQIEITPRGNPPAGEGPLGVVVAPPVRPASFVEGIQGGLGSIKLYSVMMGDLIRDMVQGKVSPSGQFVGIPGMFNLYSFTQSSAATENTPAILLALNFFGLISLSFGIANLLPIPALDGGRIVFSLPEMIFRVRIPVKVERAANLVGFVVLIILMVVINVKDLIDPIQLPGM